MKLKNKILTVSLSFLTLLTASVYSYSQEEYDQETLLEMEMLTNEDGHTFQTRSVDPIDAVDILINTLHADKLLQEEIYKRTNPLQTRSLLDLPLFLEQRYIFPEVWTFGAHLFYNHTDRSHFSRSSDSICSYLAVNEETLLDEIGRLVEQIRILDPGFEINPVDVIPLFAPMTIQQRRFGLMFHGMRKFDSWQLRFLWPLYYLERNFFLTSEEQQLVEAQLGKADDDEFAEQHLISDRIGFGDARIYVDFSAFETKLTSSRVGIQATLPIAFALKKGLKGTDFRKGGPRFVFNFEELLDIENNRDKATQVLQDFALGALDQLSANLIESGLGNEGHFGLGLYMKSRTKLTPIIRRPWGQKVFLRSHTSLEYLFPKREKRFYVDKTTAKEFERDWSDVDEAEANLAFLGTKFVDKFYPFVFNTTVHPNFVFIWNSKLCYEGPKYGAFIGSDLWVTGPTKISNIRACPQEVKRKLITRTATLHFAYQSKVFGGFHITFNRPKRNWLLGFNFDATTMSSGIGSDYTLSINLEAHFN